MNSLKKITVLIPCYNEEAGIAEVIKSFPVESLRDSGFSLEVVVIDNNSRDQTAAVARQSGAIVLSEPKQGKGNAIRTGFYSIADNTDYIVMLDGDNTYRSDEIIRLIEPLDSGFADVVVGSRMTGKMARGSMKTFNRLGNWMFSFLVRSFYRVNVTDVLTGYFAWKYDAIVKLRPHLRSQGFAIEMEMITKMAKLGLSIYSVPISYDPRIGESALHPVRDGFRILKTWLQQLNWQPRPEQLAFVSDAVYPYNKGGKERRLHEITRRLVKPGRKVTIYTMKWWQGPTEIMTEDGVYLHALTKLYPLYSGQRRSIAQAIFFSLGCWKMLGTTFDIVDVDHMPFFPLITMRIVCWLKLKTLYATWHEVWGRAYWKEYLGRTGLLGWLVEYLSFQLPDVIISNSRHTTIGLEKAGVTKNIKTIPLGVDVADIIGSPVHSMQSDVIFVGRLVANKNVAMLVRAIAKVRRYKKDISCILIGDGPERESIEQLVSSLHLEQNITMLRFIEDNSEMYGIMKASRIFVLPSMREGFGIIAVEANACGLPVLTLAHPQNAATGLIERGKNGDLFKNEAELVMQLKKYLALPERHELIQYIEPYDWAKTAELIQQEYTA